MSSSGRGGFWVIVTCMGRRAFLSRTLPSVLASLDGTYCLVDYSCPERSGDWVREEFAQDCASGRIAVVSVPDRTLFHKTEALNLGARHAIANGAEYLCFLDADSVACPGLGGFIHAHLAHDCFLVELHGRSLFGFLVVAADAFQRAGGFDETIRGYGGEDIEMRLRLHLVAGLRYVAAPRGLLRGLGHDGALRTHHYAEKDATRSNESNLEYVRARVREWTQRELFDLDPSIVALYRTPPVSLSPPGAAWAGRRRASRRARAAPR